MKPGRTTRGLMERARILVFLGVVGGVAACCCRSPGPPSVAVVHFACPGDPVVIDIVNASSGAILQTVNGVPASEPITNIPEFHDCQRFVVGGGYDSLYAIFASFRLESLPALLRRDSSAAMLEKRRFMFVPSATIYSHGGTYSQLGIEPGFNCLFLYRDLNGDHWGAKMVPWGGSSDPDCSDRRYAPSSSGTELKVNRIVEASFGDKDYPGVARWDWDPRSGQQYIGITCGTAWCEVGNASGFESSGTLSISALSWQPLAGLVAPSTLASSKVFKVKGWYDEQRLELLATGNQTPGPVGSLIPNPLLDSINHARGLAAYRDTWSHVAKAEVRGAYTKWNFTTGENQIFFCYGTTATCRVSDNLPRVSGSSTMLSNCPADPTDPTLKWWARIVSASGTPAYACVERRDHSAELANYKQTHPDQGEIRIPGAARWRYLPNDAGGWIGCPSGCCTIKE
jgi:hypothetical protein